MTLKTKLDRLDSFHELVSTKSTGSVNNVSITFSISVSTVKRLVKDLEDYKGVSIKFSRNDNSYVFDEKITVHR